MAIDPSLLMILTVLPEAVLVAMAVSIFLGAAFAREPRNWTLSAVLGLAIAGMGLGVQSAMMTGPQLAGTGAVAASGPVVLDALSFAVRVLTVVSGILLTMTASHGGGRRLSGEFLGSLLMAAAGLMLASAAVDLVLLFVALELISIPTYVLLFLARDDDQSAESAAKYFFLSVFSSVILLYGFVLLYGSGGSTLIPEIAAALRASQTATAPLAVVAMVLIFAGLAFKIAAVPFHFYAPDVYQGTSAAGAGLLAVLPKIAGVVVFARVVAAGIPGGEHYGWRLALVVAVLTMTLGNVAALRQNNIRRLLAYSSIAHGGYMLIGLAAALFLADAGAARHSGLAAMLFYLAVYALATIGAFAALAYLGSREGEVNAVDELAGLNTTHPLSAAVIGLCMISLNGIPPLAGFWGKLTLLSAALEAAWTAAQPPQRNWLVALAVITALNAAISAGYYLRIVGVMYFRPSAAPLPAAGPRGAFGAAAVCAAGLLLVGLFPTWLMHAAQAAGKAAVSTTRDYAAYEQWHE